jgi:hypothetical protein
MRQLRHVAAAVAVLWAGRKALALRRERRSRRSEPLEIGGDGAYVEPETPRD